MSYFSNGNLIINDEAAVVHESFPQFAGTIASTEVKITAGANAIAEAQFGWAVGAGSGRIVVGAFGENSLAGAAYIFDLDGNRIDRIVSGDLQTNDRFAGGPSSISVGCGRIVIGAFGEDDPSAANAGAAYIFDLDGNQLQKITAISGGVSDRGENDFFGWAVAVGDDRIVVGADSNDDNGIDSGSAYIFDLNGNEIAKILAPDGAAGDLFGFSVAVGCGRIVVGSRFDGNGSANIYDLNGNFLKKIVANDGVAGDEFGFAVSVGCGKIVVGAPQSDGAGTSSGSVYIFDLDGNFIQKITGGVDAGASDIFGYSVVADSGKIAVGAYGDDSGTGSVYVFDLDGNRIERIKASDGLSNDYLGLSTSMSSGRIIAGAPYSDGSGNRSGSAYIYSLSEDHNTYWERVLDTYKY